MKYMDITIQEAQKLQVRWAERDPYQNWQKVKTGSWNIKDRINESY
jgi:hypothetical protein